MRIIKDITCLLALFATFPNFALAVKATEDEIKKLPMYCQYQYSIASRSSKPLSEDERKRNAKYWENKMGLGSVYQHMHHWCDALAAINRYYAHLADPQRSDFYLKEAIGDISYVLRKADDSFVMLPEMLTQRGKVYALLKQPGKAAADFVKAIKVNPKYSRAYLYYADLFLDLKQPEQAKQVIKAGLAANPQSKELLKRAQRLGLK